nr:hypothetical protein [Dehalococcoidales bacterium]
IVKLARVASEPLALMWAETLRQEGIPCSIKGAGIWSSAFPVTMREHYLYVRGSDVTRAVRLLEPYASTEGPLILEQSVLSRAQRRHRRWRPQE